MRARLSCLYLFTHRCAVFYPDFARYPQLYQNHYGHLNGTLEAVLDVSQDLAQELQPFRAGVGIVLPELVVPSDEGVML